MNSLILVVTVLALICGFGSSVRIKINNHYSDDVIPKSINIRCHVEKTGNCAKTDILLQVSKANGKRIASIKSPNKINYGPLQKTSIVADGHIDDDDISNSFLEVTIEEVMKEDSGVYTCSMFYLDDAGQMQQETANANITIEPKDFKAMAESLRGKMVELERTVEHQKYQLENLRYFTGGQATTITKGDELFTFTCPLGGVLSKIKSHFIGSKRDRQFTLGCRILGVDAIVHNCAWSAYVNGYDQPVNFKCPNNGIVTGLSGIHSNGAEDRRYRFHCCQVKGYVPDSCEMTKYVNSYQGRMDYKMEHDSYMRGMYSVHQNAKEDRIFRFDICKLRALA